MTTSRQDVQTLVITYGEGHTTRGTAAFALEDPVLLTASGPAPLLVSPSEAAAAIYWAAGLPRIRSLLAADPVYLDGVALAEAPLEDGATITWGTRWFRFSIARTAIDGTTRPEESSSSWDDRVHDLVELPGRLYAVIDAARGDEVVSFLKRCGVPRRCLYEGWAGMLFGPAAPYLLRLRHRGLALPMLLREGWGRSWGIFVKSTASPEAVYRQLQVLLRQGAEVHGTVAFRFYDPRILHRLVEHEDPLRLSDLMGCIDHFAYEHREVSDAEQDDRRAEIMTRVFSRPVVGLSSSS